MPSRTDLTAIVVKQDNVTVNAGDLTFDMASDVSNGNSLTATGKEILLAYNSDTTAHTFTVSSIPDHLGRRGDIANYSVAAGKHAVIDMAVLEGWRQSDGKIYVTSSNA